MLWCLHNNICRDAQTGQKSKVFSRIVPLLVFLVQKKESALQAKICIMVKRYTQAVLYNSVMFSPQTVYFEFPVQCIHCYEYQ